MTPVARAMMAVRLFEYGDPSVLRYLEVPLPDIGPDEVLAELVRSELKVYGDLISRTGIAAE